MKTYSTKILHQQYQGYNIILYGMEWKKGKWNKDNFAFLILQENDLKIHTYINIVVRKFKYLHRKV